MDVHWIVLSIDFVCTGLLLYSNGKDNYMLSGQIMTMNRSKEHIKKPTFSTKWIALEGEKIIAEGIDLAEVYVNAQCKAKSKPQFKRVPA